MIVIPGVPVAKARPRVTMRGGSPRAYTPKRSAEHEQLIAAAFQAVYRDPPANGPVRLMMDFCMPIPSSWPKEKRQAALAGKLMHTSRPDIDNLTKTVMDALNGLLFVDDSQVVDVAASKIYTDSPRTCISWRII